MFAARSIRLAFCSVALVAFCLFLWPRPASADSIFDFESNTLDTTTTFSDTVRGLTATFSSSQPPGFEVLSAVGIGFSPTAPLMGNVLAEIGPGASLIVSFSQPLSSVSLDVGSPVVTDMALGMAYQGVVLPYVPFTLSTACGLNDYCGSISFGGTPIDTISLTNISTSYVFAVDNIDVSTTAVPEPGTLSLLFVGLLGLGLLAGVKRYRGNRLQTQE